MAFVLRGTGIYSWEAKSNPKRVYFRRFRRDLSFFRFFFFPCVLRPQTASLAFPPRLPTQSSCVTYSCSFSKSCTSHPSQFSRSYGPPSHTPGLIRFLPIHPNKLLHQKIIPNAPRTRSTKTETTPTPVSQQGRTPMRLPDNSSVVPANQRVMLLLRAPFIPLSR